MRDFYATMAQVFPVLLLALVFDSGYLQRLAERPRRRRREDPDGVRFWLKPRVRVWTLTVASITMAELLLIALVLGGVLPDSGAARWTVIVGLVAVLSTLLTRIWVDVSVSTRDDPP